MSTNLIEWLGYAASLLILISLTMSSIAKLRWFNLAGSVSFSVYGGLIGAFPVMLVNGGIAIINIAYLARMYMRKDYFKVMQVRPNSAYVTAFLDFYKDDIKKWYPEFDGRLGEDSVVLLSLRNLAVAGIFAGKPVDDGTVAVEIDFAVPQYADKKVGRHLYAKNNGYFSSRGFQQVIVDLSKARGERYFRAMGFRRADSGDGGAQDTRLLRL